VTAAVFRQLHVPVTGSATVLTSSAGASPKHPAISTTQAPTIDFARSSSPSWASRFEPSTIKDRLEDPKAIRTSSFHFRTHARACTKKGPAFAGPFVYRSCDQLVTRSSVLRRRCGLQLVNVSAKLPGWYEGADGGGAVVVALTLFQVLFETW
jgi:hypothetical protein